MDRGAAAPPVERIRASRAPMAARAHRRWAMLIKLVSPCAPETVPSYNRLDARLRLRATARPRDARFLSYRDDGGGHSVADRHRGRPGRRAPRRVAVHWRLARPGHRARGLGSGHRPPDV